MNVLTESAKQLNGCKLHIIKTDKYKTNTLVFKMKAPLAKETVTARSLLPHVLESNNADFPTTAKLRSYLDELYGASLFTDLSKKGEYHVISFSIEVANEKFLSDQTPLLKKAFDFLAGLITKPNAANGAFDAQTVEKEKRTLKQRIQAVYDDKMRYANYRLVQEMCKEEPYALHVHGELNDVDALTPESLHDYYEQALAEDELDLYVVGDVDEAEVVGYAKELFQFAERTPAEVRTGAVSVDHVNTVKEEQDVKQGKLNIGYRTNILYGEHEYYALQVFNGIFGGFSHSKLFLNVREKNSLAYYVASRLESHKGLMMVMSGIDNKNYDKAVSIINEQLEAMKNGDFTEQEIEQTKAVIKNQLLETVDTARGTVEVFYHNVVSPHEVSLEEWLNGMDRVTKDEIVAAAKKTELDTIYFLTGKEAN